jgi:hypothetical protein
MEMTTVQTNPPPPQRDTTITDSSIYIDVTINGQRVFKISGQDSLWGLVFFSANEPPDTTVLIYPLDRLGGIFDSLTMGYPGLSFSKGSLNYHAYTAPGTFAVRTSIIDSFFSPGPCVYSTLSKDTTYQFIYDGQGDTVGGFGNPLTEQMLTEGIQVSWYDSTGKAWKTYLGSADQSNSYFNILKNEPYPDPASGSGYCSYTMVTARFACNLYDGHGNVIRLTSGRFRIWALF